MKGTIGGKAMRSSSILAAAALAGFSWPGTVDAKCVPPFDVADCDVAQPGAPLIILDGFQGGGGGSGGDFGGGGFGEIEAEASNDGAAVGADDSPLACCKPREVGEAAGKGPLKGTVRATRRFIVPGQFPPTDYAAYGIVAFKFGATPSTRDRYMRVCRAYWAALVETDAAGTPPKAEQMVTVWTVDDKTIVASIAAGSMEEGCSAAVDHYDLLTGQRAIGYLPASYVENEDGPFLVAWSPSSQVYDPKAPVLALNLSRATSEARFLELFEKWRVRIQQDPKMFPPGKPGFSIETIRTAIRDFVDEKGESLLEFFGGG